MASALTVTGLDALLDDIRALGDAADDLTPVWPVIGRLWAERERRWFASRGNGSWAPFAASTLATKTGPPLVASGSLIRSLTQADPRYSSDHSAVYGPPKGDERDVKVGGYHASGTAYMPARKPVPRLTAAERRAMVKAIREHLTKGI